MKFTLLQKIRRNFSSDWTEDNLSSNWTQYQLNTRDTINCVNVVPGQFNVIPCPQEEFDKIVIECNSNVKATICDAFTVAQSELTPCIFCGASILCDTESQAFDKTVDKRITHYHDFWNWKSKRVTQVSQIIQISETLLQRTPYTQKWRWKNSPDMCWNLQYAFHKTLQCKNWKFANLTFPSTMRDVPPEDW